MINASAPRELSLNELDAVNGGSIAETVGKVVGTVIGILTGNIVCDGTSCVELGEPTVNGK